MRRVRTHVSHRETMRMVKCARTMERATVDPSPWTSEGWDLLRSYSFPVNRWFSVVPLPSSVASYLSWRSRVNEQKSWMMWLKMMKWCSASRMISENGRNTMCEEKATVATFISCHCSSGETYTPPWHGTLRLNFITNEAKFEDDVTPDAIEILFLVVSHLDFSSEYIDYLV